MKSIVAVFATVLLLTAAAGAPTVRHSGGDKTIADIVAASGSDLDTDGGDFDILLKLATLANLVPALSDPSAMLTVFAPTDAAFVQTAKDLGLPGVTDEKSAFEGLSSALGMAGNVTDIVGQILKYHVSPSMLMSADVLKMTSIPTLLDGAVITRGKKGADPKELNDLAPSITNPKLVKTDIEASNGVIHAIDRVLLPMDPSAANGTTAAGSAADDASDMSASPEASMEAMPEASPGAKAKSDAKKDKSSCFPSSAVVHLADGSELPMAQLLAGHEVKTAADEHSPVFLFTHRQLDGLHEFVRIESESGHALSLSANHYVYANGKLAAADAVRVGDVLSTLDGASRVRRVGTVMERGLVAPHTLHGDIVVNGVRASSYTRSVHPRVAHVLLAPVRAVVRAGLATEPLGGLLYDGADRLARYAPSGPAHFP
jgi:uncharacterized surface protein with fasciclin (FAS1) repeats